MSEPLITVGITCHDEGEWLRESWQSVLEQTDDRWVAVLVMDGTNHERTRDIFQHIRHPKLRKVALAANMGPYPTRNKAFELTETPYHFYLDGDDQLVQESVALVLGTFARHPEAGFVYGDYEFFGRKRFIRRFPHTVSPDDLVKSQATPGPCAYKKHVWQQLGGFALELARGNADYDFLIGAAEAGVEGRHCGRVFYRYRAGHRVGVTGSYTRRYHETHEVMVHRHPRFFHDQYRRDRFLAAGYRRAALANLLAGDVGRTFELARLALSHEIRRRIRFLLPQNGDARPW
jgi:glycosyltransferase involved in cell wall biosynthesis